MPFQWVNVWGQRVRISSNCRLRAVAGGVLLALISISLLGQEAKPIRLRAGAIDTSSAQRVSAVAQGKSVEEPVSGLFLLQFKGPFQAEWAAVLEEVKVTLLRPIPEDAYVAQVDGVRLGALRAFPFVNWVGEYRSEYKLHSNFRVPGDKLSQVPINILLSSAASPVEAAKVRQLVQNLRSESKSRFGTVLQGRVAMAQMPALAQSTAVLWIEPETEPKLHDEVSARIVGGGRLAQGSGGIGTTPGAPALGYGGAGVTVAVIDSGVDQGRSDGVHPDLAGRVSAFLQYGSLPDAADPHGHGTHVAGIIAGNGATGETDENGYLYGLGVAPQSKVVAQRIFDSSGRYVGPTSYGVLAQDAVRAGAVIGSNSWGEEAQGRYDVAAMEFDALVRDADGEAPGDQPYLVVSSVGNAGPGRQSISSPAVAKNVIAAGASQNERRDFLIYTDGKEAMADFSSRGPCEDGRLKPDLVAPGTWIASLQSSAAAGQNAWLPISDRYFYLGGTSQSAPQIAGAAALFIEYYRESHSKATPSPALIKAALINAATDMDDSAGTAAVPNHDEGWGRINVGGLLGTGRSAQFVDQSELLTTGGQYENRILVASDAEPLKVTLAYTDVPGMPAAIPALVNDLDLQVIAPDGRIYLGNQFNAGESVPGRLEADRVNNVEAVHLRKPLPGEYVVRVRAANVMEDARKETAALDQDFALAISGDLSQDGVAVVLLDRATYSAPGAVQLKVIDFDRAGQPSVQVRIRSLSERLGELVTLYPNGAMGVFTGAVATVEASGTRPGGPPLPEVPLPDSIIDRASPGVLELDHEDTIDALYEDVSPAGIRRASAVADLKPPVLSDIKSTNRLGKTWISWQTSEPATTVVRYGDSPDRTFSVTNLDQTVDHEIALERLESGKEYFYTVTSFDAAGNWASSTNQLSFIGRPAATVLIVDAYQADSESTPIAITSYTDPLDQIGVSYEIWDVQQAGSPRAIDLQPFRAVMWRISDSIFVDTGLTLPQQKAIEDYVRDGGSFFMASMEVLSRLGNTPFRTNVLQVAEFKPSVELFRVCENCDQDAGVPSIAAAEFDPLMNGVSMDLDYSEFPTVSLLDLGPDFGDTFTGTTNAVSILVSGADGRTAGIRYPRRANDQSGRVVFLSFPLEAVPMEGVAPNSREGLLRNVLGFLAPGADGLGTIAFDRMAYTVPGRLTIELADSDLIGRNELSLRVFSDTGVQGQEVRLSETVRPGMYRGSLVLAAPNALAISQLKAKQGDRIWAEYRDASTRVPARAIATVDTSAPVISNVAAAPEYEAVTIEWETSEPTDGLVQFGESVFLGRTAYHATVSRRHRLHFRGLKPDRVYFYQLMSRDPAGNAVIDENGGRLYRFRTLKPLSTPWSDNFETSGAGWRVVDETPGTASWSLGDPASNSGTRAPSGTRAWGSNLAGAPIELGDTRLVSPAVHLRDGNKATLRFWQSYQFSADSLTDLYEFGQVNISTDNGVSWSALARFEDESIPWKLTEIDLTPFLGKVVRFSWHYHLLSLERSNRPGWMLDDIAVSVITEVRGIIRVSSNLSQAGFRVSGATAQTGGGSDWMLSNAPAGQYVIQFNPVPYYETPAPLTNQLETSTTILFHGNYTFPDQNQNGMSDLWEREFFGDAASARTMNTDTDRDGFSDYAEFMAGTNPTNIISRLQVAQMERAAGSVRIAWPSAPGRAYRLLASDDQFQWQPLTGWERAVDAESSRSIPVPKREAAQFFRVEVRP